MMLLSQVLISKVLIMDLMNLYKPVVGSSKKIKLGFDKSSTPIETLFLSPPLTPLIILFPLLFILLNNTNLIKYYN